MNIQRIVVKYHNRRMILTVDLNALFNTLFDAYGDGVRVEFSEMNEREKAESSATVEGLRAVRERFWVLETMPPDGEQRREDLEQKAVALGKK